MKLDITQEWLLKYAAKDDNGPISVGGLATRMEHEHQILTMPLAEFTALGQLVRLQRRRLNISIEQLATNAEIEIEEILSIEQGQGCDEPRTVFQLANALKLPQEKLLSLAGLVSERDPQLQKAALKFAARSAPMEKLNKEETEALEEFVKVLAK